MLRNLIQQPGLGLEIYGEEDAKRGSILITSRHGAGMESPHAYRLLDAIDFSKTPFSRETAESYVNLEQDAGADELARAMAMKLATETRLKVYLVTCGVPRAFFDGNRLGREQSVRLLARHLDDKLVNEYLDRIQGLNHLIGVLNQTAHIHIGVHSMWPFSPRAAEEGINPLRKGLSLKEEIEAYLEGESPRPEICLINQLEVTHKDGSIRKIPAADMDLNAYAAKALKSKGYRVTENDPYPMGRIREDKHKEKDFDKNRIAADFFAFAVRHQGTILFECSKAILGQREGSTGLYLPDMSLIDGVSTDFADVLVRWHNKNGSRGRT